MLIWHTTKEKEKSLECKIERGATLVWQNDLWRAVALGRHNWLNFIVSKKQEEAIFRYKERQRDIQPQKDRDTQEKVWLCVTVRVCVWIMHCAAVPSNSAESSWSFSPFIDGVRMTLWHVHRKCSLPERAAENIPHTWQHGLKIAPKPLIQNYRILAQQAWDPHPFRSRFNVCNLHGYTLSSPSSAWSSFILFLIFFLSLPLYILLPLFGGFANQLLIDFISQAKQETQQDRKPL